MQIKGHKDIFPEAAELRICKAKIKNKRTRGKNRACNTPEVFRHAPMEIIWLSTSDSTCQRENRDVLFKAKEKHGPSQ
jgi:hypothetical protein